MAEKKNFSLPAAARELGVSTDLLRRQYRNGLVPAITTPGGQPRFTAETIEAINQNGWPQWTAQENKERGAVRPIPRSTPEPEVLIGTDSRPSPGLDHEMLDFEPPEHKMPRRAPESEQFRTPLDHRRWINHALHLLPYWLTPDERFGVARQIASEIRSHTPEQEQWMPSICTEVVQSVLRPLERQREISQASDDALKAVLARIPSDATETDRMRAQALARNAIQHAREQGDCKTLFPSAWEAVVPVIAALELRRRCDRLRIWALKKTPFQANEKEQREAKTAITRVLDQTTAQEDELGVRVRLEEALEPVLASIASRLDEGKRRERIEGLVSSAKPYVATFLSALYNQGELDYEAICDWEWRRELEGIVDAQLRGQLSGNESNEKVKKMVEDTLDSELEETDDDE